MSEQWKSWTLLALMCIAALLAQVMRPTILLATQRGEINLEQQIPRSFGNWHASAHIATQIVNPEQVEVLGLIYSHILSRSYISSAGELIMLSIAYGPKQNNIYTLHYPDVCYPAQGFQLVSNVAGVIRTRYGPIRVKRLETALGNRKEPVTYWSTVGNHVVFEGTETKYEKLKYGINGQIPDGLIFRVSSIGVDSGAAFKAQEAFVNALLQSLTSPQRAFFAGLQS